MSVGVYYNKDESLRICRDEDHPKPLEDSYGVFDQPLNSVVLSAHPSSCAMSR